MGSAESAEWSFGKPVWHGLLPLVSAVANNEHACTRVLAHAERAVPKIHAACSNNLMRAAFAQVYRQQHSVLAQEGKGGGRGEKGS